VKINSPIGEFDYRVEHVAFRDGRLEVAGRLGEWETTTIVEASDFLGLVRRLARPLALAAGLLLVTRRLRRV
jgi:hypothetical protein